MVVRFRRENLNKAEIARRIPIRKTSARFPRNAKI